MRVSLIAVAFCFLLLGACNPSSDVDIGQGAEGALQVGAVEATDSLHRIVSPADRQVVLDGFRGHIDLQGRRGETADLTLTTRGRGADSTAARAMRDDVQITETGTADTYTFEMTTNRPAQSAVDVAGTVPTGVSLRILQESGQVNLRGVRGDLVVRQRFGNVTIRDAAGAVDVSTETGDLAVAMDAVPRGARIVLRTANGDVHTAFPPDAPVQVDAQTRSGEVRVQGLTFRRERLTPVRAGARYTAQIGTGGTVVELRTENGIITLAAADTTSAAPSVPDAPAPDSLRPDTLATPQDTVEAPSPQAPSDTAVVEQ
jgi:hypothetical protein